MKLKYCIIASIWRFGTAVGLVEDTTSPTNFGYSLSTEHGLSLLTSVRSTAWLLTDLNDTGASTNSAMTLTSNAANNDCLSTYVVYNLTPKAILAKTK